MTDTIVTYERKKTRHGLHMVASILTGGFWLMGWVICWAYNAWGPRRRKVTKVTRSEGVFALRHPDPAAFQREVMGQWPTPECQHLHLTETRADPDRMWCLDCGARTDVRV